MGYITSNQGRPIQGVSQQPEKTRFPGQCTVSDNLRPDIVRGLINRPGTLKSAELETALLSKTSKWYHYSRGTGENYIISIEAATGKTRAWSLDGTEHIINVEDSSEANYLASDSPKTELVIKTIGDYTFIVNNTIPIEESTTLTPAIDYISMVYVQFMDYSQTITIFIDDVQRAVYTSPDGSAAAHLALVDPAYVIANLLADLNTSLPTGWTFSSDNNIITVEKDDGTDYDIRVSDGVDNANAIAIKDKIKNTTLLPGTAPDGFIVEVDPPGSNDNSDSNYYLQAEVTSANHMIWKESIEPSISVGPDISTMPHVLVRESITAGVATFTLRQGEWDSRDVGSDRTNPQPTFINTDVPIPIQSIGVFQNRLYFTAGESAIMTRSANFFNFYRSTVQASLDTDPIDIFSDAAGVNFLKASVSFDEDLVFFSDNAQFILDGAKPITKDNAVLKQSTVFGANLDVSPVASGDSILFAFEYGLFTGIREFFTDSITDTKKARPVTDHVKQYVKGSPTIMDASTNLNMLVIKTDNDDNILYTYDWLWQGAEKVQSAWGRYTFPEGDTILYFKFIGQILQIIMMRDDDSIYIESMNIGDPIDSVTNYQIRSDRQEELVMVKTSGVTEWTVTDPFPLVSIDDIIVVRKTGAYDADIGATVDIFRDGGNICTFEDLGLGDVDITIGTAIDWVYSPTNPVALDEDGQALSLDRLTVAAFYMNYNSSGDITATVTSKSGKVREYDYTNRTTGGPENIVGFAPLVDGQHRVAIRQKSDAYTLTFNSRSELPIEIRDFEYNGNLNRRGRRL